MLVSKAIQSMLEYADPKYHTLRRFTEQYEDLIFVASLRPEDFENTEFQPFSPKAFWYLLIESDDLRWKRHGFVVYISTSDVWIYDMWWMQALQMPLRVEKEQLRSLAQQSGYELSRFIGLLHTRTRSVHQ